MNHSYVLLPLTQPISYIFILVLTSSSFRGIDGCALNSTSDGISLARPTAQGSRTLPQCPTGRSRKEIPRQAARSTDARRTRSRTAHRCTLPELLEGQSRASATDRLQFLWQPARIAVRHCQAEKEGELYPLRTQCIDDECSEVQPHIRPRCLGIGSRSAVMISALCTYLARVGISKSPRT
jgi:hypothetical protein